MKTISGLINEGILKGVFLKSLTSSLGQYLSDVIQSITDASETSLIQSIFTITAKQ